ncbi:hypothetical protein GQR58_000113 [Nymphon striatum]|nr:hypothetical protein GQR58_000113 [Nymphon striatum]
MGAQGGSMCSTQAPGKTMSDTNDAPQTRPARTPRRIWNFTPNLPIQTAPYWDWPMKPMASLMYLLRSWNPVGLRCLFLLGAIITWMFFTPELSRAQNLAFDWIAQACSFMASQKHQHRALVWPCHASGREFYSDDRHVDVLASTSASNPYLFLKGLEQRKATLGAEYFDANLAQSTGLKPQQRRYVEVADAPERVRRVHRRMKPHYDHLYQYRITPK